MPGSMSFLINHKYHFALLVVSSLSSKLLHLYSHRDSLPILLFILYTPTFLIPDVLLIVFAKLLVYRDRRIRLNGLLRSFGALLAVTTACASAAQVSFYLETGGEVQWVAASSLATDHGGLHLLLSGLPSFSAIMAVFFVVARLITPAFHDIVDSLFACIWSSFLEVWQAFGHHRYSLVGDAAVVTLEEGDVFKKPTASAWLRSLRIPVAVLAVIIACSILQTVRPWTAPYDHMSGSLPFTLIQSLLYNPANTEFCLPHPLAPAEFPFNEVSFNSSSKPSNEPFPGWAPQSEACRTKAHRSGHGLYDSFSHRRQPDHWLQGRDIAHLNVEKEALERRHRRSRHSGYDPICDPLKVSNLDQTLLQEIQTAFGSGMPSIKHVVLLTLESTRKDVFPIMKDSHVYNKILETYANDANITSLDHKLAHLTQTAELLTGQPGGWDAVRHDEAILPKKGWRDYFNASWGGINVQGAMTGSAFTLKSLITSHCGVEALPVDFTEEVKGKLYQPCIPHILDRFNAEQKHDGQSENAHNDGSYLSSPWESVLVQSITDQWDSQDILDPQMGFKEVLVKATLLNSSSKYYPPKQPENNYFGFPETEVLPYLRDMFNKAEKENRRLFISHVTSTTHHPFALPELWNKEEEYVNKQQWRSQDPFNRYLNTVKYQDEWLSTMFDLLEETGVFNQTLVVLVGDHGLAFDIPDGSSSTFENGHISNFNVPLLFLHPQLPRIQVAAKTTSVSIIPTILDLLIQTDSLDSHAKETALNLIHRYQGQSLTRPFISSDDGREPWYFGIINPGGSVLAVSSAATTFRLIMPLCSMNAFRFTDLATDPAEEHPVMEWTMEALVKRIRRVHGEDAVKWILKAEKLGRWWFWEQRERWDYHLAGKSTDRGAQEGNGGRIKKEHWWETK